MPANIVKTHGRKVSKSPHSKMTIWEYNGFLWAVFRTGNFAYLWGKA